MILERNYSDIVKGGESSEGRVNCSHFQKLYMNCKNILAHIYNIFKGKKEGKRSSPYRERLRPLLDHKPFDNMRQDLGFHNGLWWFILTILGGSAGDAGGRVSVP